MIKLLRITGKLILFLFCLLLTPIVYFRLKRANISMGFWNDSSDWLIHLVDDIRGKKEPLD